MTLKTQIEASSEIVDVLTLRSRSVFSWDDVKSEGIVVVVTQADKWEMASAPNAL